MSPCYYIYKVLYTLYFLFVFVLSLCLYYTLYFYKSQRYFIKFLIFILCLFCVCLPPLFVITLYLIHKQKSTVIFIFLMFFFIF